MNMLSTVRKLLVLALLVVYTAPLAAQSPDLETLGRQGPYQVAWFTQLPTVPEFSAATLYFPANKAQDFSGVVISPGFTHTQENISWWGTHLASHGYAVITLDTNDPTDDPYLRADALMAAIGMLRAENTRQGSAIRGKILEDNMAVMGHSMGGGGTLLAANEFSEDLKAAIPMTSWLPDGDFSSVAVPTLAIAGEIDQVAPTNEHAWPHYQTLSNSTPRMFMEIEGGNHFIVNTTDVEIERFRPNIDVHDLLGGVVVAWLKLFVDGEEEYRELLFGNLPEEAQERLSRYEYSE